MEPSSYPCSRNGFRKSFSLCRNTHSTMRLLDESAAACLTVFSSHMRSIRHSWSRFLRIDRQQLFSNTRATWSLRKNVIASGNTNETRWKICLCRLKFRTTLIFTTQWSIRANMRVSKWLRDLQTTCSIFSGLAMLCLMTSRTWISTKSQIISRAQHSSAAKTYSGETWIGWGSSSRKSFRLHQWATSCKKSTVSFKLTELIQRTKKRSTFWSPSRQAAAAASK